MSTVSYWWFVWCITRVGDNNNIRTVLRLTVFGREQSWCWRGVCRKHSKLLWCCSCSRVKEPHRRLDRGQSNRFIADHVVIVLLTFERRPKAEPLTVAVDLLALRCPLWTLTVVAVAQALITREPVHSEHVLGTGGALPVAVLRQVAVVLLPAALDGARLDLRGANPVRAKHDANVSGADGGFKASKLLLDAELYVL